MTENFVKIAFVWRQNDVKDRIFKAAKKVSSNSLTVSYFFANQSEKKRQQNFIVKHVDIADKIHQLNYFVSHRCLDGDEGMEKGCIESFCCCYTLIDKESWTHSCYFCAENQLILVFFILSYCHSCLPSHHNHLSRIAIVYWFIL